MLSMMLYELSTHKDFYSDEYGWCMPSLSRHIWWHIGSILCASYRWLFSARIRKNRFQTMCIVISWKRVCPRIDESELRANRMQCPRGRAIIQVERDATWQVSKLNTTRKPRTHFFSLSIDVSWASVEYVLVSMSFVWYIVTVFVMEWKQQHYS